jgi:hypothetical protein
VVQFAVKIGWICEAKLTLAPQATHVPAPHIVPDAHALPHDPQLLPSVWRSTQAPEQAVMPVLHAMVHIPLEHDITAGQTVPHEPQLFVSVSVFTQFEPHTVRPVAQPHVPLEQAMPAAHA